jgi:hypothetical protein
LTIFDEPTISASPIGPMIFPMPPKPGGIGDLRECRFDQLTAGRAPIREICSDF